jgi:hypothetical protein
MEIQKVNYNFNEDKYNYNTYQEAHYKVIKDICNNIVLFTEKDNYVSVLYLYDLLNKIDEYKIAGDLVCNMLLSGLNKSCLNKNIELVKFYVNLIKMNEWKISYDDLYSDYNEDISINTTYYNCLEDNFFEGFKYILSNGIVLNLDKELIISHIVKLASEYNGNVDEVVELYLSIYKINREELKKGLEDEELFDNKKYFDFCKLYKIY